MSNIHTYNYLVTMELRNQRNQHKSKLLWFTGLSGSGKSTLANATEQFFFEQGLQTYVLDGDNLRNGINAGLGFSREDRVENLRRIAEIAKLFINAGTLVCAAFVSPLESDRELVKSIVGQDNFFEIYVSTPLSECESRDVKGLYKKARLGEIVNFTGISAPYEQPINPNITIDTTKEEIKQSVNRIANQILPKIQL